MTIQIIHVGPLETNCYIVSNGDKCIVIDPGEDSEKIIKEIGDKKLEYIILTHLHFDHIIACRELKVKFGCKILCNKADFEILDENLLSAKNIDGFLEDNTNIPLTTYNLLLTTISTPGHTPGSICLYSVGANGRSPVLFSGDTIFAGSIGVTHFKGGDFAQLKASIENKLFTLPDNTHVYPGHGRDFVLGDKKEAIKELLRNK